MKGFYFDTLLDAENICNLDRERALLLKGIDRGKKLVVYGPRNFGKTSLVKNVVIPDFRKKKKGAFVLFADLMEVKDLDAIHHRIGLSFQTSFAESFPGRNLLETARRFLKGLRPEISIDPLTSQPTLTIAADPSSNRLTLSKIFDVIKKEIAGTVPVLIVLDEFQDIAFVPEAQGLFRQAFQELQGVPMVLMGSKRHILSRMFSVPKAPLASFGEDIEFHPIPYEKYHAYILERFQQRRLIIDLEVATVLQDALFRIPEAINIVCDFLHANLEKQALGRQEVFDAIGKVVASRRSRYEELLALLTLKEEAVLVAVAKAGVVRQPTGREFLRTVPVSQGAVKKILDHFLDKSIIDRSEAGYRINDPLFHYFLRRYR